MRLDQQIQRICICSESGSTSRISNKFSDEEMPTDGQILDYYVENVVLNYVKMLGGK